MTSNNKNNHIEPEKESRSVNDEVANKDKIKPTQSPKSTYTKDAAKTNRVSGKQAANEEKQAKRGVRLGAIAIVLSLVFGGGLSLQMQQQKKQYQAQIDALQTQLSHTQTSVEQQLNTTQQNAIEKTTQITHHVETTLEQQQKSLESLQLAIADVKGRRPNDWLLAEADYLVKLAGRKLFLEHDAVTATQLMESADQRIATLNDPSLVPLRKVMANDITKLKTVPLIDREGLVLRLTSLQQQVDKLPLANALLPEAQKVKQPQVSENIYDWQDNLITSLKDFSKNFITFRTRDGNVIPLLSPQQHFYLKENIKAKLETAIKAVYIEQQEVYVAALTTANEWSNAFFNQDDNSVVEFNKMLESLSKQNIQVEYPVKLDTQQQLSDIIRDRLRRDITTLIREEK